MKLGFIGTGNLASAILRGVVSSGKIQAQEIMIYDIGKDKTDRLKKELGVIVAETAIRVAKECENIVIAVKPKDVAELINEIKEQIKAKDSVVISTAAGTCVKKLVSCFGYNAKIIRIMPNINAAVCRSMTALCASENVEESEKEFALSVCRCFGDVTELEEKYFSAFTALSGSAPAFVYMFADALTMAGIKHGIPSSVSQKIAAQMILGSAAQIKESPLAISELIRNVCSPSGTTIEGVCSLKSDGFEAAVINAIDKTVDKDKRMNLDK